LVTAGQVEGDLVVRQLPVDDLGEAVKVFDHDRLDEVWIDGVDGRLAAVVPAERFAELLEGLVGELVDDDAVWRERWTTEDEDGPERIRKSSRMLES
jgi:hypothetical protein